MRPLSKSLLILMGSMAAVASLLVPRPALTAGAAPTAFVPVAARRPNGARTLPGVTRRFQPLRPLSLAPQGMPVAIAHEELPETVDLTQFSPPVQDQGDLPTDPFWASAYYQRGWYAKRDGYYPAGGPDGAGGFAMMYIASQVNGAEQHGTTMDNPYAFLWSQGVDTREHYSGNDNPGHVPTAAERANARRYGILSWSRNLFDDPGEASATVRSALAHGDPVVIGFKIYESYLELNATNYRYVRDEHQEDDDMVGGHAFTVMGYDPDGVWAVDSLGTGFGLNGWVHVSWNTLDEIAVEGLRMVPQPFTPFVLNASATAASPFDVVQLSGKSFTPGRIVTVHWNEAFGPALEQTRVRRDGTFKVRVLIPPTGHGHNRLLVMQNDGLSIASEMTVLPRVTLQKRGLTRRRGTITGSGFPANAEVRLNWDTPDGPQVGFVPTDAYGYFTYRYTVPSTTPRPARLVASADVPAHRNEYYHYNTFPYFLADYPYADRMSPSVALPRRRK